MANILFHAFQLEYRGGSNSLRDYAHYNETVLGNKSTIVYHNPPAPGYQISYQPVIDSLSKRFEVISIKHDENLVKNMNDLAKRFDLVYSQRGGCTEEPIFNTTKFAVHSAFANYSDQCDRFAYISKYLSDMISLNLKKQVPYVPYILQLPEQNDDLRTKYGISKDQFVFGRLGGWCEFDVEFVHEAIKHIVNSRDDIVFMLVNTNPFYNHKNIIYLDPFYDQQFKSNFINSCDAMIHARRMGETFGLAVMEFLYFNKPVLSWESGDDKNHVITLNDFDLLYNDTNIISKIEDMVKNRKQYDFSKTLNEYTPSNVMDKFQEVFINAN